MPIIKMKIGKEEYEVDWDLTSAVPVEWELLVSKLHPITSIVVWGILTNNISPMTMALAQSSPDWERYSAIRVVGSGSPLELESLSQMALADLDEIFEDVLPNYKSHRVLH
jgi:hypothetical protein